MDAAKDLLKRAVELDSAQKYPEALICYEQGVQNLLRQLKETRSEVVQKELRSKAEEYLGRAEQLKQLVKEQESPAERVQCIHISQGSTGYSYERVFQCCLDGNVHHVDVQDPYIIARHQLHNFVRFCELVVKNCKNVTKICLMTTDGGGSYANAPQGSSLTELKDSLKERGVDLEIAYSSTLHDREIRFSNGWIVKLGRGLDYFQKPKCAGTLKRYENRPRHNVIQLVVLLESSDKISWAVYYWIQRFRPPTLS